jgi:hypothetical protein
LRANCFFRQRRPVSPPIHWKGFEEPPVPAIPNEYDAVPYPGYSFPDTHPDRMAVMAALHGVAAASPAQCRVLEIGCNEGANLIPMAAGMPNSEFVGFDLAGLPIARGQERIRALGLSNIRLFQADLCEVTGLGACDYIIAHGLYTWVPQPVRDRLLGLCRDHLSAHGVVFLSYNALPGSHIRDLIRDALRWRAQGGGTPEEQIARGLDLLALLIGARPEGDAYRQLLEEQLGKLRKRRPETIYHDELSPAYQPVSIAQMIDHARSHGLEFLSEAVLPVPSDPGLQPRMMQAVDAIAGEDRVAREQVLDFARMRLYRETLLVRSQPGIRPQPLPEALVQMRLASTAGSAAGDQPGARVYTLQGGVKVGSSQPAAIAVMERLIAAWPRTVPFAEIGGILGDHGIAEEPAAHLLLQMAMSRLLDLHLWEPAVAPAVSARPRVPLFIRHEAQMRDHVATLWHGTVELCEPRVRSLLLLLDGTRDRAALLAQLRESFPGQESAELEQGLEANLRYLLLAGLLEA